MKESDRKRISVSTLTRLEAVLSRGCDSFFCTSCEAKKASNVLFSFLTSPVISDKSKFMFGAAVGCVAGNRDRRGRPFWK